MSESLDRLSEAVARAVSVESRAASFISAGGNDAVVERLTADLTAATDALETAVGPEPEPEVVEEAAPAEEVPPT